MRSTAREAASFPPKRKILNTRALSEKRAECVREIELLRRQLKILPPLAEKARRLLQPRYWSHANWRTRAEILRSVEWLLRMAESAPSGISNL